MSNRPENLIVRMLRWIDSGVSRLMERVGHTEQQAAITQTSLKEIAAKLDRIDARLDDIEQRLPPRRMR